MTKAELYIFVTSLLNEIQIDTTLFGNFLDNAQMEIEGRRPWVILRAQDVSQTVPTGNVYTTPYNLPADFKEWHEETPVILRDVNNNPFYLSEVPFSTREEYRLQDGKFCVDYVAGKLYVLGTITQSFTLVQNYIKLPTLVSSSDSASWVFPARFHKILGLMIAEKWKNGVDYDVFSNAQANQQAAQASAIYNEMTRWDSRLQNGMTRGINPFTQEPGFDNVATGSHII